MKERPTENRVNLKYYLLQETKYNLPRSIAISMRNKLMRTTHKRGIFKIVSSN